MADIHQIITLGIGTPSDIEHLTLFGLSAAAGVTLNFGETRITFETAHKLEFEADKELTFESAHRVEFE